MTVPPGHPRYASLQLRERLVEALRAGWLAEQGLTAHGRGEAFDYLLGETTTPPATRAIEAAALYLVAAARPVVSINGNAAALAPDTLIELARTSKARIEVNLFHRTPERVAKIVAHLERHGATRVLGAAPDARIPGLASERGLCSRDGIFGADVVFVPLEDGDRCEGLRAMGKTVVVVDLNPLSRTARAASVTIVDNIVRAVPALTAAVARARTAPAHERAASLAAFDNAAVLADVLRLVRARLDALATRFAGGALDT